ncbi:LysE/ArgO family amino acid transporter [Luteococcus japonicus]|uniref:Transporter, LysE family n=1 Tax=Luteococcus japonicus LSP_Lj1 TaxID=1255658 RepID=A0A1R4KJV5_9ACTN|nr:LysE/ArgO family amino acid transporter [Luteococcus japonicus]SJN44529.1 Transporter, LysE family [Luteococcus japonicus LSP_Lj1]
MLSTWFTGLATGLSLIIVIGVQNALVLRQGLRREHVGLVVAVCALGDLLLIGAGTAGMGAVAAAHPGALRVLSWVGAAYLLWCAIGSFRAAANPGTLGQTAPRSRSSVLGTVLAVTWLNPHVYLDTVVMLGSIAASHGPLKWAFAAGAMCASLLWFTGLGFGARALSGPLDRPSVWRAVDVLTGLVMVAVAISLLA